MEMTNRANVNLKVIQLYLYSTEKIKKVKAIGIGPMKPSSPTTKELHGQLTIRAWWSLMASMTAGWLLVIVNDLFLFLLFCDDDDVPFPFPFLPTSSMMAFAVADLKIGDVMGLALLTRLEEKLFSGELGGLRLVSRDDPKSLSCALMPLVLLLCLSES